MHGFRSKSPQHGIAKYFPKESGTHHESVKPTNANDGAARFTYALARTLMRHSAPERNTTERKVGHCLFHACRCERSCARGSGRSSVTLFAVPGRLEGDEPKGKGGRAKRCECGRAGAGGGAVGGGELGGGGGESR